MAGLLDIFLTMIDRRSVIRDCLQFTKDNKLILVGDAAKGDGKVYTLSTTDDWNTATNVSETVIGKNEFPTTATLAPNGKIYVISSKLGKLLAGDKMQSEFTLQQIQQ